VYLRKNKKNIPKISKNIKVFGEMSAWIFPQLLAFL
jgi:hypothetical protein